MKKLLVCILFMAFLLDFRNAAAQGGQVILDLSDNEEQLTTKDDVSAILEMGVNFWDDVKEYDELLEGKNIDKDFTDDILAKYPKYDEKTARDWQKYIKKGVKAYRFYKDVKQKIVNKIMDYEMPLIVDDDQYEMGENEEYIVSDKPVVIHDFKKVIAYSGDKKDQLSVQEKYAKDHGLDLPSEKILKYKKALLNKDWENLLGFSLNDIVENFYKNPEGKSDIDEYGIAAVILTQFKGVGEDGKIAGTVEVNWEKNGLVLLNEYNKFEELKIGFDESDNIKNIKTGFILPLSFAAKDGKNIVGYTSSFPIYFYGEAIDAKKPVHIKAEVTFNFCFEESCRKIKLKPKVELKPEKNNEETLFASHVRILERNIPSEQNAENFEFENLILEENEKTKEQFLLLDVKSDDIVNLKVFMWGKEAKYFSYPQLRIDEDRIVAKFRLIDKMFDPLGKDITFWVATKGNNQYIHTMKVEKKLPEVKSKFSMFIEIGEMALGGGLLLNLMPFGLLILSFKIIELTKFGRQNRLKIRGNFMGNALGIMGCLGLFAIGLAALDMNGYCFSWEMQLQNAYFVALMIWMVLWLWLYVVGVSKSNLYDVAIGVNKSGLKEGIKGGAIAALLLVALGGAYVGNAYTVASSYGIWGIIAMGVLVAIGVTIPYWIIVACPAIVMKIHYGIWVKKFKLILEFILLLTIVLLLNKLEIQTSVAEKWCWVGYLLLVSAILAVAKVAVAEADKIDNLELSVKTKKRIKNILFGIAFLIILQSFVGLKSEVVSNKKAIFTQIDQKVIDEDLRYNRKVLVKIEAEWCWICKINNAMVFDTSEMNDELQRNNVKVINVDWTKYNDKTFNFMQKFARMGPPFYIFFSKKFTNGIVLPEIVNADDLKSIIEM